MNKDVILSWGIVIFVWVVAVVIQMLMLTGIIQTLHLTGISYIITSIIGGIVSGVVAVYIAYRIFNIGNTCRA